MKKLLILLVMVLSCGTIETQKSDWASNVKIDQVFFVLENIPQKQSLKLIESIKKELAIRSVNSNGYFYDEKKLNAERILKQNIEEVHPRYILSMPLTAIFYESNKEVRLFEISILDLSKGAVLWKCKLRAPTAMSANMVAKKLMVGLERDDLVKKLK